MSQEEGNILIVAGEASSSLYALRFLQSLKKTHPNIKCFGVGSREMEKEGFDCIGRSEDMAVVGLQEVLAHYSDIKKVFNELIEQARKRKPKVILLLDYPDFNLRLAKKLKPLGIPVVYYISPQLWAWRTGRIKIIQKYIDKMLVVFPFEKPFYDEHNVDCEFVGHPLLDELSEDLYGEEGRKEWRNRYGFVDDDIVFGLMPGSRRSELKLNLMVQIEAAERVHQKNPNIKIMLAIAPSFDLSEIQEWLPENLNFPLVLVKRDPFEMIRMCDVVLTASGTATVMVGLMHTAMVVMYRMKKLTAWIARKLVKGPKYFGMVNLVLEDEVAKELFQEKATPENMASEIQNLLDDNLRKSQQERLKQLNVKLGNAGATERVVEAIKPYLEEH